MYVEDHGSWRDPAHPEIPNIRPSPPEKNNKYNIILSEYQKEKSQKFLQILTEANVLEFEEILNLKNVFETFLNVVTILTSLFPHNNIKIRHR